MEPYEDFDEEDDIISSILKTKPGNQAAPKKTVLSNADLQHLKDAEDAVKKLQEEDSFSFKEKAEDKNPRKQDSSIGISNKKASSGVNDRYGATNKEPNKAEKGNSDIDDILAFLEDNSDDKPKSKPKGNTPNVLANPQPPIRDRSKNQKNNDLFEGIDVDDNEDEIDSEYFKKKTGDNFFKGSANKTKTDESFKLKRDNLFGIKRNDSQSQLKPADPFANDQLASTKTSDFGAASTLSTFNPISNAKEESEKNEDAIGTIDLGKSRRRSPLGKMKEKVLASPQESQEDMNLLKRPTTSPGVMVEERNKEDFNNLGSLKPPLLKRPNTSQSPSIDGSNPNLQSLTKKDSQRTIVAEDSSPADSLTAGALNNQQKRGMKKMADFSANKNVSPLPFEKDIPQPQFLPENPEKASFLEQINYRKTAELEDFKSHLDALRKAYEDQIKLIKENHQKDLEFERKAREHLLKEMEDQVKRERQRNNEILDVEIRKKEELQKLELDEAKRKHMIETDSLKNQIEHQVKLLQFSEEMRQNTEKLQHLSQKIEVGTKLEMNDKLGSLHTKEIMLQDTERRLKVERETLEAEKVRLQNRAKELQEKEERLEREFLKDKEQIRKEYQRLTELQDELRNNEEQRKRAHDSTSKELKVAREQVERERLTSKAELENAWRELRLKQSLLDQERKEIHDQIERNDILYREKVNDLEARKAKLIQDESDIFRRKKVIEAKEFETQKLLDEYQTKADHLNIERMTFEKEAKRVQEIARKVNDESSTVNKIIKNFDFEKDRVLRREETLDTYAKTLDNEKEIIQREKQEMALRQKTLDHLRYNYVKELDSKPDLLKKIFEPRNNEQQRRIKPRTEENQNRHNKSFSIADGGKILREPSPSKEAGRNRYQENQGDGNASFISSQNNESLLNQSNVSLKGARGDKQEARLHRGNNNSFDLKEYMRKLNSIEDMANKNQIYLKNEIDNLKRNRATKNPI